MLKQIEIGASQSSTSKTSRDLESKNTESKIIVEAINRNVNEKIKIHNENQYEIIQSEKSDGEYRAKLIELRLGF